MIKKGQRYIADEDLAVTCLTAWSAPYTGGYRRILPAGEEFVIANDPPPQATAVYADPVNYGKLHKQFVSWTDRIRFLLYNGYDLGVKIELVEKSCTLVTEDNDP